MTITSQDFSSSDPTIAGCTPNYLPLTPCAPFAQGTVTSPVQSCCDNLQQLYNIQPQCLCLLLNDTTLSAFPINATLALELPILCNLQINASDCPGLSVPVSPTPPHSQVLHGSDSSSNTVAASPLAPVASRPNIANSGFIGSGSLLLKPIDSQIIAVVTVSVVLLITM